MPAPVTGPYNDAVSERLSLSLIALVALVAIALAPWAAVNRETGARSTVVLLPNRIIDFTGRTEPVPVPGQAAVLVLSLVGLAGIAGGALGRGRVRQALWLASGVLLIATTAWGLARFSTAIDGARLGAFEGEVQRAIERPRPNQDVDALKVVLEHAPERGLAQNIVAARAAGLIVRRLPYDNAAFGASAFLLMVTGLVAVAFGLKLIPGATRAVERATEAVAVPATSILLALLAAAVVILALQPTPTGPGVVMSGAYMWLVGRIDTLWYAYFTMFHDSLGTLSGFLEALKFATPLIFTGLAVAFGFRAGLFNIGAPGQMVLGAIFAMLAGVYLPGPRVVVLPAAILASALGGGLWGALPGWLKARFGANEVINTILLNFVAASLLLFILSSNSVFAAPALRGLTFLGPAVAVLIVLLLFPAVRRFAGRAPRVAFAVVGVVLLAGVVVAAWPRPNDAPVVVNMPFKVAGSEPKSQSLRPEARLAQVPALLGIDLSETPGVNRVPVDVAALLAPLLAIVALALLPRLHRRFRAWTWRLGGAVVVAGVVYLGAALAGLARVPTDIPPTKLNVSFLLALLAAFLMYVFLWRTKWGFELRAVGLSPRAAEYGGASIARNTILALAISGALAGMSATHYVLGGALEDYALRQSLPTSDGFDGIAVALLGNNAPGGIVLAAFLFGVLKNGGSVLNIAFSQLTRDVVSMILALVVLFIAAKGFLPERLTDPLKRAAARGEVETVRGPPGTGEPPGQQAGVASRTVAGAEASEPHGRET